MSHSVKVTIVADQEIELIGDTVNIHELQTIYVDSKGEIVGYSLFPDEKANKLATDRLEPGEGCFVDAGKSVFKLKPRL